MRFQILVRALAVVALLCSASRALASAPDVEPDFGPWCEANRTIIASSTPNYPIKDVEINQLVSAVPMDPGDGSPIRQLVFELEINHTWIGDLVVRLEYTDCGTGQELFGTNVICRPRGSEDDDNVPCGTASLYGCSGNLGKSGLDSPQPASQSYWFADESTNILDNGACAQVLGKGCYQPSPGSSLQPFEGLPRGGCWKLYVSDWKLGDVGSVTSWEVWELNPLPTATTRKSWGQLKTIYR